MRLGKLLLLGIAPAALSVMPVLAQSTGSAELETVTVSGNQVQVVSGLENSTTLAKQVSTISQTYLENQAAGQTVFESLNMLPGVNFENQDAYGSNGGTITMHGQDGAHISVTLDGIPLNDTGNYALYTNQMMDSELISTVSVNQGTTDVDSPTAAVTGGAVNIKTAMPDQHFTVRADVSGGTEKNYQRYFVRVDSGAFGPWGTTAYFAISKQNYDKFLGHGSNDKLQLNAKIRQDFGSLGWMQITGHWNRNRNHSMGDATLTDGSGKIDKSFWKSESYITQSCDYETPTAGVADSTMTGCTNWYKIKINPSDTGNVRLSSLWHVLPKVTLTLDGSLQYTLANGGGGSKISESDARLIGTTSGGSSTDSTTAFGCVAGQGCDLNGDGDTMDKVLVYSPSTTNTRRWGANANLIYQLTDEDFFRIAYSLDYGIHRQTGQMALVSPEHGTYGVFAGWNDRKHAIVGADGTDLRKRDRTSRAILNQIAVQYDGAWLDGDLHTSIGARVPFFQRDLRQNCYTEVNSTSVLCTTETAESNTNGTFSFTSEGNTEYVAPGTKTVYYSRFLPHVGLSYRPLGGKNLVYVNYTQELAAPKTDSLYQGSEDGNNYSAFNITRPETSTSYTIGYRYLGEDLQVSLSAYNNQVKNRIISQYDQDTSDYTYRNVKGINYAGVDFDANYRVMDNLSVYGSVSYTSARQLADSVTTKYGTAETAGQQLSDVPNWTMTGRVTYSPVHDLRLGLQGKFTGRRFGTDDGDYKVPDYTIFDADLNYSLERFGLEDSSIQLNVKNLFDRHYYSRLYTQTCGTACGSSPYAYLGSPRTFTVKLAVKY